ncbi:NACHT, LRR and PYD domains-containing protein 3, partial [Labeo rohita]
MLFTSQSQEKLTVFTDTSANVCTGRLAAVYQEEQGKDSPSKMSFSQKQSERSSSPVFSSVSVKSDQSKGEVANFSEEAPSSTKSVRSGSLVFSSVSVKSDRSKGEVANFSSETPSATKSVRSDSSVLSSVSVKSHQSKGEVVNFSEKKSSTRSGSHVSSSVSVRSDHSKGEVANFNSETPSATKSKGQKTTVNIGAEFTRWEALKVQKKMSDVDLATFLLNRVQYEKSDSDSQIYRFRKDFRENLYSIFQELEKNIIIFLKSELKRFKTILKKENTQYFVKDFIEDMCDIKEAALDITLYFLRQMKKDEVADTLKDELVFIHQQQLISHLKKKYQSVSEGIAKHGDSKLLNNIYTDLYITQGGSKQVNTEHEVRQIEAVSRCHESQEIQVECTNLFETPEQRKQIRTVLTKGVAGIGKSVSVQKFIVDWAERLEKEIKKKDRKENQEISFIFPLPFREMNLIEKEKQSLMDILSRFFPEIKGLNLTRRNQFKALFILDGLDECRLPLNFEGNEMWSDVSSPVSLDVLLTNLIKGNLLPSSLIWITTRPAAASKIPPDCIDRVTEVRGFNDAQKEEYFKKRFTDENLAKEIIDHVKRSKSLFIMCHIPVFCWISATVLQNILEEKKNNGMKNNQADDTSKTLQESNTEDTPKTLTQMYTHFLRFQILQSSRKYDGEYTPNVSWDKDAILSLGKLAFHQLEKNNLIFCDVDLEACGIDVYKASVYSGMCTQIFKEERGVTVGTMFCFVHLSIQEFIAALYAHLFLVINKKNALVQDTTEQENKNEAMIDLLKTAVDKALESENGHLDLFLRFLLGLSLHSNRLLLRGLLTQQDSNDQIKKEIVQYIKQKFEANLSPERSINLFYCLNELNDQTLVKEIQTQLREGSLSSGDLSPAQWSALAFVLLTSEEELEQFELQKFKKSDECFFRLSEVVKNSKRALLNDCNLTDKSCLTLAKVLESDNSLKELNMNNNNLQDSGMKKLCTGLRNIKCKLEILTLSQCMLTEESCSALASVLSSDSSSLKDLDLSNNNLQDSGVKLLSGGMKGNSKLQKLILANCSITEAGYKALASALRSKPSHLLELDLTGNDPGLSGVKQLNDLLQDPNCQLKLTFLGPPADEACQYVTGIVGKNPLLLSKLHLSGCELGITRVKQIAALLQDKHCKLNTLMLNNNNIREEDCAALASAFISNRSNLKKFDISENKLGNSGLTKISTLLGKSQCTLQILRLSNCSITEEGYKALASALRSNPSHLIELDLTGNDPGQSGVKELNGLLQDPNCQLKTLRFLSPAADEACQYVTGIVGKNPLLLKELNLSGRELGDTQVNQIAALLQDKHCKLNTLMLNSNNITAEVCTALSLAFNVNPSNLIELDLSGNKLGNLGIEKICPLLKNAQCRLKKLKLSDCSITEEGCKALASALRSNPSHLIELDLTGNDPGQSGVKELDDLLQDECCKLKTIRFLKSPTAQDACDHLTKVLGKSPLLLKELDLSEDALGDLNWEKLSVLLMDSYSKVEKIQLNNCELTEKSCSGLATVLSSKTILKEMNLNNSHLLDSGVKQISEGLKNPVCELKILKLSHCGITEEGYKALALALRSNPLHLIELDLTGNDPGQSGVKQLDDLLNDQNCHLKMLRLLQNPAADEACQYVIKHVGKNPLHLRELNLSEHELGDTQVSQITALLEDKHCKLNTLT